MDLDDLAQVFIRNGLGEEFREQEPLFHWAQVVGPRIARLTEPLQVRGGVLYVRVGHPVFAQELTQLRQEYLRRLNARLGEERLKEIRFKVGELPLPNAPASKADPDPTPRPEDVELSAQQRARLEEAVRPLEEGPLKQALRRFFETLQRAQNVKRLRGLRPCSLCGVYHHDEGEQEVCVACRLEGRRQ